MAVGPKRLPRQPIAPLPEAGGAALVDFAPGLSSLTWWVHPQDGRSPSWPMNLTAFRDGDRERGLEPRPELIGELAPAVRAYAFGRVESSKEGLQAALTRLWSFLDHHRRSGAGDIGSVAEVGDVTGELFKSYLLGDLRLTSGPARSTLGLVRALLDEARARLGVDGGRPLLWPTVQKSRATVHHDVDEEAIRYVYAALKSAHRRAAAMLQEGAALLSGAAPPGAPADIAATDLAEPSNVAALTKRYLDGMLAHPTLTLLEVSGGGVFHTWTSARTTSRPSALDRADATDFDRFRWFVPTFEDTTAAFLLVALHTGWNPETSAHLDVSARDRWCMDRLAVAGAGDGASVDGGTAAIFAHKGRAGREQIAFSSKKPEFHPFRVIETMIRRTEPLRDCLRRQLEAAEKKGGEEALREAQVLRAMIASPWLFLKENISHRDAPGGRVGWCGPRTGVLNRLADALRGFAAQPLLRSARAALREAEERVPAPGRVADHEAAVLVLRELVSDPLLFVRTHLGSPEADGGQRIGHEARSGRPAQTGGVVAALEPLPGGHGAQVAAECRRFAAAAKLAPSDFRDGFAAFVYENSLRNILLVGRALNHGSLGVTKRYLQQRRHVAQRFKTWADWQDMLFDEVRKHRRVDPTILFIRVRFGDITDEQRARLSDQRNRTRMGMGCLDSKNPPVEVAPLHRGGDCIAQRCTFCRLGVVFEESFGPMAVRMAELRYIRGRTPLDRWEDSSFQLEWIAIEATVANAFPGWGGEFERRVEAHLAEIKAGRAYVFDQVGVGEFTAEGIS